MCLVSPWRQEPQTSPRGVRCSSERKSELDPFSSKSCRFCYDYGRSVNTTLRPDQLRRVPGGAELQARAGRCTASGGKEGGLRLQGG